MLQKLTQGCILSLARSHDKKAIENTKGEIEVLVDNATARENIIRLVKNLGLSAKVTNVDDEYIIHISR